MTSVRKFAAWPPAVPRRPCETAPAKRSKIEMWAENLSNQERAWNEVAGRTDAIAAPDLASFRAKTRPVLEGLHHEIPGLQSKYLDGVAAIA